MKILIGTPIHDSKDYSMEPWLKCVAELRHPADLFMLDNSIGSDFAEKVRGYCAKLKVTNYKIAHIELPPEQKIYERVARSREVIRHEILNSDYDAWFTLECDQIVPPNTLDELIKIMQAGDFMMVNHNGWDRKVPNYTVTDFNVSLIRRDCLEQYSFLLGFGTDPDMPDNWEPGEAWFKQRVLKGGGSLAEVENVIKPIYHLDG